MQRVRPAQTPRNGPIGTHLIGRQPVHHAHGFVVQCLGDSPVVKAPGAGPRLGGRGFDGAPVKVGRGDHGDEQADPEKKHEEEADVALDLVAEEVGAAGREAGNVRRVGEPGEIDDDLPVVGRNEARQVAVAAEQDAEASDGLDVRHGKDNLGGLSRGGSFWGQ